MIDIRLLRENPKVVQKSAKDKGIDVNIDSILNFDKKAHELSLSIQKLREERNKLAKATSSAVDKKDIERGKKLKEQLHKEEKNLQKLNIELQELLYQIPNIPAKDVPVGKDETGNKVIRKWGKPRTFDFENKDHLDLGKFLDIIDVAHAAKIVGTRSYYLKGNLVLLEFAIIQYAFSVLTDEKILKNIADRIEEGYSSKPFIPVIPPVMIRPDVFRKMARIDPQEDRYYLSKDDLFLTGSAEHTLGPLHMDETILEKDLPIRYVGFSTSFRRESGTYGKDTRGILRVHQFDKIELETFTTPENSIKEQEFLVAIQEYLMQSLELPYQVVMICTGEMGGPDARQVDIETWIPSQKRYRETHTADLMTDYQSRRLQTKTKRKDGKTEFVHMNDATAFAMPRLLIAILENYQQKDGSIIIPKVLQSYTNFAKISPKSS